MKRKIMWIVILLLILEILVGGFIVLKSQLNKESKGLKIRENTVDSNQLSLMLYENILDKMIQENEVLAANASYISLDILNTFNVVTGEKLAKEYQKQLLTYAKQYENTVYQKSISQLIEEGLGNNEMLSGYFVSIGVKRIQSKEVEVTAYLYRSGQGAAGHDYVAKYEDGVWNLQISSSIIS